MLLNDKRKVEKSVAEVCKSGLLRNHSARIKSNNIILDTSRKSDEDLVEGNVIKDLKIKEELPAEKITLSLFLCDKTDEIAVEAAKACASKEKLHQKSMSI